MNEEYLAIVVFGEYNCYDFVKAHEGEKHTPEEWYDLAEEFRGDDGNGVFLELHHFQTRAEMLAFAHGIEVADNYFSDDFYSVVTITEGIIYSAEASF